MHSILLVEDDVAVREALLTILTHAGWDVTAVGDATEAEAAFTRSPADVVLSDFMMPGHNALELLSRLRVNDSRLAFVVMSGFLSISRVREVLLAGASDCLAKPCSSDTLIRALERALMLRQTVLAARVRDVVEQVVEIIIPADMTQRTSVLGRIDEAAQVAGFDPRRNRIMLALDEAFSNAVHHGAKNDPGSDVSVRASFSPHGGVVTVSDPGPGFDPLIAGFGNDDPHARSGLFLIKAACDDVHWLGRGNVCQMVFRQPGASGIHRPPSMVKLPSSRTNRRFMSPEK